MQRVLRVLIVGITTLSPVGVAVGAETVSVHVQRQLHARQNVHITFHARHLAEGGYYYAVIVLKPYKKYTRAAPPPCSTSSNMQRTDYGYPQRGGEVALALAPAKSRTGHWCLGGDYLGAIYAVPHTPPCEWAYPQGLPTPRASGTTIVGRFSVRFASP
jgi:hypothetical protein